jgi:hypothetical protein
MGFVLRNVNTLSKTERVYNSLTKGHGNAQAFNSLGVICFVGNLHTPKHTMLALALIRR